MIKKIKKYLDLPFEENTWYTTKFQTGEKFLIKKIISLKGKVIKFEGFYASNLEILCPLNADRLIPDRIEDGHTEVCHKCGEPI